MKKILAITITLIFIITLSIILTISKNNDYISKITKNIKHTLNQDITYISYYNYHYIVKNNDTYLVLNDKYDIIKKETINNIPHHEGTLIYKNNKFVYEVKKQHKNEITYTYYDAYNNEEIKSINLKEG